MFRAYIFKANSCYQTSAYRLTKGHTQNLN